MRDTVSSSTESRWFAAARLLLLGLLLAAPLAFGAVEPWAWGTLIVMAALVMVCWAFGCLREKRITLLRTPLYIPALMFAAIGILQSTTGSTLNPIGTRDDLVLYAAYFIIFAISATLFAKASAQYWLGLAKTVTIYTLALSVFAILQFFTSPDRVYWTVAPRWGGFIFGPYVNHNHYAGLMEMLVPLVVAFWMGRPRHELWNWLAGFTSLIALASVALSGSRGGISSLLLEMAGLTIIMVAKRRFGMREKNPAHTVALGIICVALLVAWMLPPEITARLQSAVHSPEAEMANRVNMTRDSFAIFRTHLPAGTGLGSFEAIYPQFQSFASDLRIDHAHNDYAEALAETGLPGAIALALAFVFFLIAAWRNIKHLFGAADIAAWMRVGATAGCCGLLLHSFFDFNLHIPANAAWMNFMLALVATGGVIHSTRFHSAKSIKTV